MALSILDGNQTATTLSTILSSGQHITAHTVVSLGTQAKTDILAAVSSGIAISGTVTANVLGASNIPLQVAYSDEAFGDGRRLAVSIVNSVGEEYTTPLPISGTINSNILVYNAQTDDPKEVRGYSNGGIGVCLEVCGPSNNSVTIGGMPAVPVFGTVTANSSNGSLTTRFGSVTTANTAFATSAVTNANRKYLLIQNVTTASNAITVGIGFTPTTTQGIQLSSGAVITFEGNYIPTGAVNLLSSVTASCFTILEA